MTRGRPHLDEQEQVAKPAGHQGGFAGDVLKLVSGTTIAQALGILVTPLLTRLYAPEAFGTLAVFTSIVNVLSVIACMRYELAIMLPKSDEEAANLLGVSLIIALVFALLIVPVIHWAQDPLLRWLQEPGLKPYLWLVPIAVLLTGGFLALNYWNSRTKQFGRLSIARVVSSGTTQLVKIIAGYTGFATAGALIDASVIGNALVTVALGGQIWRDDRRVLVRALNWKRMKRMLVEHRKFPLYSTWAALLNTISWQLPTFLLAAFFSSTVVGYYAIGFKILHLPMSLIGSAVAQVFFQRAVEAKLEGTLREVVKNTFRWMIMLGLFPILTLAFAGSDIYSLLLGASWAEAGLYTQILSIWAFFWFISSPLSTLFSVLERQEHGLRVQVFIFLSRLISLVVGGYLRNVYLALALFSVTGVLVYGYLGFWIMHLAGTSTREAAGIIVRYAVRFVPAGVLLLLLKLFSAGTWLVVVAAVGSVGGYLYYLIKHEPMAVALLKRIKTPYLRLGS